MLDNVSENWQVKDVSLKRYVGENFQLNVILCFQGDSCQLIFEKSEKFSLSTKLAI